MTEQKTDLDFSAVVEVKYRHLGTAAGNALHAFCGDLAVESVAVVAER